MKIHNYMTYLSIDELHSQFQKDFKQLNREDLVLTREQVTDLIENNLINSIKVNDEWYVNELDACHYVDMMIDTEKSEKVLYGGGIGVNLTDLKLEGRILDLGGGGEAIISQLKGDQVVAIDPNKRELEHAPEGGLKVIMDGKDLKFLDNTFDTATSFFTLMYIPKENHKQVLSEIYRVLKPDGEFVMWDVNIPKINEPHKEIYLIHLEIHLPQKIQTGYGVRLRELKKADYIELATSIGFDVVDTFDYGTTAYSIRFIKK